MSYGSIYESIFESPAGEVYIIDIQKLNYSGSVTDIVCAGASPVLHKYQTDDPKAPVAGCAVEMSFVNDGSLPLSSFYSVIDNEYRVVISWRGQPLFIGFVLADDSEEDITGADHEIKITATDNLGLLKDVPLNNAAALFGSRTDYTRTLDAGGDTIDVTPLLSVEAGDLIQFPYTSTIAGTYKILSYYNIGSITSLKLDTNVPAIILSDSEDFTIIHPVDLTQRLPLAKIIRLCLLSTGLELVTFAYTNIVPSNAQTDRFLEQTLISGETFLSGDKWDDCYTVLEKIMRRFNACLFQSFGVWNIQRWNELRYYGNATMQWKFSIDMDYVSANVFDGTFIYYNGDDTEAGITSSILRPYKFIKDTFNYKQPESLLCNYNFQKTGNLIRSYADGTSTVYEYEMICWSNGPFAPYPDRYIRVIIDNLGNETARFGVITGATGDFRKAAMSEPIDVEIGDVIKYSFAWRTKDSHTNVNTAFTVRLSNGSTTYYLQENGDWDTTEGIAYGVVSPETTDKWQNISYTSKAVPFAGQISIFLGDSIFVTGEENWYKDLQFEYTPGVNELLKIIGHTHNDSQIPVVKNRYDEEIYMDDSPRSSIQGALFLVSFMNGMRARTTIWDRKLGGGEELKLGQLITNERLFWRRRPRTKINGTLIGLVKSGKHVQKNICLQYNYFPDKNFVIGSLSIDYKNDLFQFTATEEYETGEVDGDLIDSYQFKYLYQNK